MPSNPNLELWQAAAGLDLTKMEIAIENGAEADYIHQNKTALLLVLEKCTNSKQLISMLELLLGSGASANYKKQLPVQPLTLTVRRNQPEAARILLKYGADPQLKSGSPLLRLLGLGQCAQSLARKLNRQEILTLFKEHSA